MSPKPSRETANTSKMPSVNMLVGTSGLARTQAPDNDKLDVLIVYLTAESKLERARTAIRNFVADHLKIRDEKDAALVAFVSPSRGHLAILLR